MASVDSPHADTIQKRRSTRGDSSYVRIADSSPKARRLHTTTSSCKPQNYELGTLQATRWAPPSSTPTRSTTYIWVHHNKTVPFQKAPLMHARHATHQRREDNTSREKPQDEGTILPSNHPPRRAEAEPVRLSAFLRRRGRIPHHLILAYAGR